MCKLLNTEAAVATVGDSEHGFFIEKKPVLPWFSKLWNVTAATRPEKGSATIIRPTPYYSLFDSRGSISFSSWFLETARSVVVTL